MIQKRTIKKQRFKPRLTQDDLVPSRSAEASSETPNESDIGEKLHSTDEDLDELRDKLQTIKTYYQLKSKQHGLKAAADPEELNLLLQTDQSTLKRQKAMLDRTFQAQISAKTETGDEYLEEYLAENSEILKKTSEEPKVEKTPGESNDGNETRALFSIPENLQVPDTIQQHRDETIWSVGLAEVPLTFEERLRNIEAAEKVKRKAFIKQLKQMA